MSSNRDMLSGIQITALVGSAIIGVGLITLPKNVALQVGTDGALTTGGAGLGAILLTTMIAYLSSKFPNQTIIDYSKTILGAVPAKLINAVLFVYFTTFTGIVVRAFADAIKVFLLQNTPLEVIIFSMLVLSVYLVQNGINPLARICEAFFPIVLISISILIWLSLQNFNIQEFYSFWQVDVIDLLKAMPSTILAYLGFEILLLVGAFVVEPKKLVPYGVIGTSIAAVLYVVTVVIAIGVFTTDTLKYQRYPTLELAKSITFPGAFAERFDIFFAIFWILAVFTTVAIFYYLSAFSITKLIGLKNYRPFCYLLLPVIYFTALMPQNIYQAGEFSKLISYFGGIVVFVIPGILLVVMLIRRKGVGKHEKV